MANYKETGAGRFPGGPVVKTLALKAGGMGSIPCQRTKELGQNDLGQSEIFYHFNIGIFIYFGAKNAER